MTRRHASASIILAALSLPACGGDPSGGGGGGPSGLAVVSSDLQSATIVSLVDPAKPELTVASCIDSNSTPAGLSSALSGDVMLPSAAQPGHELLIIDRSNSALTWMDAASCTVLRQLSVGQGFSANPYDVIAVGSGKAYVTRFASNPSPTPDVADFDDGGDLLIIDPARGRVTGAIALDTYKAPVTGKTVEARPTRGVLAAGRVYIAIDSSAKDYSAYGEGRLVIVNPDDDTVTGTVALTGLKNCSSPALSADGKTLLVPCAGSWSNADQTAASGVAVVDLTVSPPELRKVVAASGFGGPLSVGLAVSAAPNLAYVSVMGSMASAGTAAVPDSLWSFDPSTGTVGSSILSAEAYSVGGAAFDAAKGWLFVTIAESTSPRLDVLSGGQPAGSLAVASALPPRLVGWY